MTTTFGIRVSPEALYPGKCMCGFMLIGRSPCSIHNNLQLQTWDYIAQ